MTTKLDTLENTIRDLAKRGEISNISLSMNSSHTKWRGSFAMCSVFGLSYAEDADPVTALLMALTSAKGLRSKRPPTDREIDAAEARATAKIDQPVVDVVPDEYLAGITAKIPDDDCEDLM